MLTAAHPAPRNKDMVTVRLQTLRSQHIIMRYSREKHKKCSLIISWETCQERHREAPEQQLGSVVRKLLSLALQWTASPGEAAWPGPEALPADKWPGVQNMDILRLMSCIYQTKHDASSVRYMD